MTKKERKKLKSDVIDLLNQVVIKLKDVQHHYETNYDDDGNDVENPEFKNEDHDLCIIKLVCKQLAEGNEYSDVMEYFNSYCYWESLNE